MAQIWLVTVPNNKESNSKTLNSIQKLLDTYNLKVYEVEIPNLVVGTLDTLIALADELNKISIQTENVVKKVERQYSEICGSEMEPLRINENLVEGYLKKFQWDYAHYQHQGRQLKEIVNQIQSMANKIDEDLKLLVNTYTEKTLSLSAIKRKKIINLVTSDIEDFLEPKHIANIDAINTDYLITILVAVPKSLEIDFLETYNSIGSNIASYGGPDYNINSSIDQLSISRSDIDRSKITGSPVVPNSAKKVLEDDDYALYAITVLKGQYQAGCILDDIFVIGKYIDYIEPLKVAFREKKFIIRDLIYNETKLCGTDQLINQAEQELNQIKSTFIRWCKAHFSTSYNGWLHLKLIQAFVESVLRYGLPINFTSFFFEPNMKNEKDSLLKLTSTMNTIRPELLEKQMIHEDGVDEDEDDAQDTDNLPYVCLKLAIIGSYSFINNN